MLSEAQIILVLEEDRTVDCKCLDDTDRTDDSPFEKSSLNIVINTVKRTEFFRRTTEEAAGKWTSHPCLSNQPVNIHNKTNRLLLSAIIIFIPYELLWIRLWNYFSTYCILQRFKDSESAKKETDSDYNGHTSALYYCGPEQWIKAFSIILTPKKKWLSSPLTH